MQLLMNDTLGNCRSDVYVHQDDLDRVALVYYIGKTHVLYKYVCGLNQPTIVELSRLIEEGLCDVELIGIEKKEFVKCYNYVTTITNRRDDE